MKFLTLYKPDRAISMTPEHMAEMQAFVAELKSAGILLATEGAMPDAKRGRVRLSHGEFSVTDGPFTESKELIAGFALLQVKSQQELLELSRRFLKIAGDGESEFVEIFEPSDASDACR